MNDTTKPGDQPVADPLLAVVQEARDTDQVREAYRRARAEESARKCAIIRAATLEPLWRTETAHFELNPPIRTDFGDKDGWTYRVTEVQAKVTRYVGKARDEDPAPHLEVECWGHRLTAKGEPNQNVDPGWISLPAELAAELLGRAMVA